MIEYDRGYWGVNFMWTLKGSVLQKSFCWAFPNAVFAALLHLAIHRYRLFPDAVLTTDQGLSLGIGGYTMVLGFLLVFRTREAYSRWWESITLLLSTRGEWFGAYSNLLAFCSHAPNNKRAVEVFQHKLARLMSLLYGSALDQVSTVEAPNFEVIDLTGFDEKHLDFLASQDDKLDIVIQWLQQLIVTAAREGIIDIAPPILSRVFQELSRGKVNVTNARKLSEFPFPFPYVQLLVLGLVIQWFVTPLLMCILCEDFWWASITSFISSWFMWSINYVGEEIEEPYGDDANDLPLGALSRSFNNSLVVLLQKNAQSLPVFTFDPSHRTLRVQPFGCAGHGNFVMPGSSSAQGGVGRVLSSTQEEIRASRHKSVFGQLTRGNTPQKLMKARGFAAEVFCPDICDLVTAEMRNSDVFNDWDEGRLLAVSSPRPSCKSHNRLDVSDFNHVCKSHNGLDVSDRNNGLAVPEALDWVGGQFEFLADPAMEVPPDRTHPAN